MKTPAKLAVTILIAWGVVMMYEDAKKPAVSVTGVQTAQRAPKRTEPKVDPMEKLAKAARSNVENALTWKVMDADCRVVTEYLERFVVCAPKGAGKGVGSMLMVYQVGRKDSSYSLTAINGTAKSKANNDVFMKSLEVDTNSFRSDIDVEALKAAYDAQ